MKKSCLTFLIVLLPVLVLGQEKEPEFRYGIKFGMTRHSVRSLEERTLIDRGKRDLNDQGRLKAPLTYEGIDENEDVWEIEYYFNEYARLNKIVESTNNPSLYLVFLHDMKNEIGEPMEKWTSQNRVEKAAHFYAVFSDKDRGVKIILQLSVYSNDSSFYMHFSPLHES
jgi:hypothetical protein